MIGSVLIGGLGNQMFQYAIARKMAIKNNTKVILEVGGFKNMDAADTPRSYELDCYKIQARLAHEIKLNQGGLMGVLKRDSLITTYSEPHHEFDGNALKQSDRTIYRGYWQTEKYFLDVRKQLLEDFDLKGPLAGDDLKLLESIRTSNSVSIHVRRGDYISNKNANQFHGTKDIEYYTKALEIIKRKESNLKLYIFSDDIEWCKKALASLHEDTVFVDGNRPGHIDMYLMKNCKHNIIANSSFSWWGAWLNENKSKIVVAPKEWFKDSSINTGDVLPSSWFKI